MRVLIAAQFLLGLFCLTGTLVCRAGGAYVYDCNSLKNSNGIKTGDIITTSPYGGKLWCGSKAGKFLALSNTKLVYLKCPRDVLYPEKATVTIFDVSNLSYRSSEILFDSGEQCSTTRRDTRPAAGLTALANKLSGVTVAYDGMKCNAIHYFDYLRQDRVPNDSAIAPNCPVLGTFTDARSVESNDFRLEDKRYYYKLPANSMVWGSNSEKTLIIAGYKPVRRQPTHVNGSTRSSKSSLSRGGAWGTRGYRYLMKFGSGNGSNASRTQGKLDTTNHYHGGGAGLGGGHGGWDDPSNPSGTGGVRPGSYPDAGAYPYSHPDQGQRQKSAASRTLPLGFGSVRSTFGAGLRMIGG